MSERLTTQAGSALLWRSLQHGGIKAIFLVRTLVLARLLVPEDFGLLAISLVAVDFLDTVTDLGTFPALVQRGSGDRRYMNTAWTVNILRASAITLLLIAAAPFLGELFAEPRATALIAVVALRPLVDAAASIRLAELTRDLRFGSLTAVRAAEVGTNAVVSIALAPFFGVWALIAGILAGQTAQLLTSYAVAPYRPSFLLDRSALGSLVSFGRWLLVEGILAAVASFGMQAIISRELGAAALGLYSMAARLAWIPSEVASEVFGAVAFPLFARLQTDLGQAARAFRSILTAMMALLVPLSVLMIVLAPSLVHGILGPRWEGTEILIQLLALVGMVGLIGDTIVPILKGTGRTGKMAMMLGLQSGLRVFLVWLLLGPFGIAGAAYAWLGAVIASGFAGVLLVHRVVPRPFTGIAAPLLVILVASAIGGFVAWTVEQVFPGIIGVVAGGSLAAIACGGVLLYADRRIGLGFTSGLTQAYPRVATLMRLANASK